MFLHNLKATCNNIMHELGRNGYNNPGTTANALSDLKTLVALIDPKYLSDSKESAMQIIANFQHKAKQNIEQKTMQEAIHPPPRDIPAWTHLMQTATAFVKQHQKLLEGPKISHLSLRELEDLALIAITMIVCYVYLLDHPPRRLEIFDTAVSSGSSDLDSNVAT